MRRPSPVRSQGQRLSLGVCDPEAASANGAQYGNPDMRQVRLYRQDLRQGEPRRPSPGAVSPAPAFLLRAARRYMHRATGAPLAEVASDIC